ncbi:hypothetical protein M427DRAFT_312409 [Gonapodya prolifera JEL478]|uniref:Protein transport protein SEC22 n=1 Tax=Gonapodya prolifera (strain JEL478) TaxID=1344416 RepID=A0A139AWP7_GONPJ|nr:hypothetical protein M427DRAFT_312409 [Gonapodya prolifera JEL478]|eukprot:KXS21148.1 hypothetical protein M427DRAFT_312409 [Gonapodya prolifera JEL478]
MNSSLYSAAPPVDICSVTAGEFVIHYFSAPFFDLSSEPYGSQSYSDPSNSVSAICYLAICERTYPRLLAFSYLLELERGFNDQVSESEILTAVRPYAFIRFENFIQTTKRRYLNTRSLRTQDNIASLNSRLPSVPTLRAIDVFGSEYSPPNGAGGNTIIESLQGALSTGGLNDIGRKFGEASEAVNANLAAAVGGAVGAGAGVAIYEPPLLAAAQARWLRIVMIFLGGVVWVADMLYGGRIVSAALSGKEISSLLKWSTIIVWLVCTLPLFQSIHLTQPSFLHRPILNWFLPTRLRLLIHSSISLLHCFAYVTAPRELAYAEDYNKLKEATDIESLSSIDMSWWLLVAKFVYAVLTVVAVITNTRYRPGGPKPATQGDGILGSQSNGVPKLSRKESTAPSQGWLRGALGKARGHKD